MKARLGVFFLILTVSGYFFIARETNDRATLVYPPWYHCLGVHKVTQTHLSVYSGFKEEFINPQGLFCTKLYSRDDSTSICDDDELTIYGVDEGTGHILYNKGFLSLEISDGSGSDEPGLKNPVDLTGDRDGNLFVTDRGNDRVMLYKIDEGKLIPTNNIITYNGIPLASPFGVSLDRDRLYVTDSGNNRIAIYEIADGVKETESSFSLTPELIGPTAIAIASSGDQWLYYDDYFIALVDSFGHRLWKIPAEGEPELFRYESLPGSGFFSHLDIDYYGNIYVTDPVENNVHKFDRNLRYIIGLGGKDDNSMISFDQPRGIAIYKRFGQIFVSQRSGCQYFWIGTDIKNLKVKNISYDEKTGKFSVNIFFLLTEYSTFSLYFETDEGDEKYTLFEDYLFPPGVHDKVVEGRLKGKNKINKEIRGILAIASPTYSSVDFCRVEKRVSIVKQIQTVE
ncbi:MAG TPA: NHL repeat-containing protein [Candidatus Krumholzibacteriaceae bacterium]|nr:NHL repeat-containing protein [Candidatus Krumholzibacteriaceae bacterium]